MARVDLEILRGPYRPALACGIQIGSCRLLTDVSLRSSTGATSFRPSIVDTGAPISLFPRRFWQDAAVRRIGRIQVSSLVRSAECMFDATLAVIELAVRDRLNQIAPIETYGLLADTDQVPAVIGMCGVLTELILHSDIANNEAYLATRS